MKTALLLIGIVFSFQLFAQNNFYINPSLGIVWNSYNNSNKNITGNEDVANIFWDNDWILGFLAGYVFDNRVIIESGFMYHNAANRYHLNYPGLSIVGGSSVSLGEGYYCIPLNIKYKFETKIKKLYVLPYIGSTFSTHNINSSPYLTDHDILYSDDLTPAKFPVPQDTTAVIQGYRTSKNNILINYGVGIEYHILKNMIFTLSGNFTSGFNDMNRLDIDVFLDNETETGQINYRGNKFFVSGGLKLLFGFRPRD